MLKFMKETFTKPCVILITRIPPTGTGPVKIVIKGIAVVHDLRPREWKQPLEIVMGTIMWKDVGTMRLKVLVLVVADYTLPIHGMNVIIVDPA